MIKVIPRSSQNLNILSRGLAGWDCLILPCTPLSSPDVAILIQCPETVAPQHTWPSTSRHTEEEITDTLSFTNRLEENKISRNKLNQEVNDLDNENFKPLKEKTQKDTRKWEDIPLPCSRIDRISIVEMTILSKVIYRFCAVPIKITISFFTET